jgi:hypothetical protein
MCERFDYDGLSHCSIAILPGIFATRSLPKMQPDGTSFARPCLKPSSGPAYRREPVTILPIPTACQDRQRRIGLCTSFGSLALRRFRTERSFLMREANPCCASFLYKRATSWTRPVKNC